MADFITMAQYEDRESSWLRGAVRQGSSLAALLPIMAAVFFAFLVIGIAMPVLPLHVHQGLGLGTFIVGLVAGSQFAAVGFRRGVSRRRTIGVLRRTHRRAAAQFVRSTDNSGGHRALQAGSIDVNDRRSK